MQTSNKAAGRAGVVKAAFPELVTLVRSTFGGHMVMYHGALVGWLQHDGDQWNAYAPARPPAAGRHLGTFDRGDRAVCRILTTAGFHPVLDV
ncbi:hypothetical protein [Actinoplanes flavus]|uniref:Uncharacterized protein n=1 Tax=Actinoplanes flavus TaxID=2820290 RepID=A0ABS3UT16_9ACTN|nr:hypothetical protein [Actinoplanes flavus]MBO3741702.1 hypothetical protein [Actinoplanes flavus]